MNASTTPITADEPAADLSRRVEALRVAGTGTTGLIVRIASPGTAIVPSDTLRDLLLLAGSPRITTTDLHPGASALHPETLARVIAAGEAYVAAAAATNPTARREALMAYYAASDAVDSTPHGQRP